MNKTLYLRDEDAAVWDRARELADEKLSPVVVAGLRKFVAEQEAQIKMMDRIVIRFSDKASDGRPTAKAFYGRWLITPEDPYCPSNSIEAIIENSFGITATPSAPAPSLGFTQLTGPETTPDRPRYRSNSLQALMGGAPSSVAGATRAEIPPVPGTWLRKSYAVAVSAKGSVVLFCFGGDRDLPSGWLWTYPSFDIAIEKNTGDARPALHEALKRQGMTIEELDI